MAFSIVSCGNTLPSPNNSDIPSSSVPITNSETTSEVTSETTSVETNEETTKEEVASIYHNTVDYMNEVEAIENNKSYQYVETKDYTTVKSIKAMVKWFEYLYLDDDYVYVDKFVGFNLLGLGAGVRLLTEVDKPNNKLYAVLLLKSLADTAGEPVITFFYYFEIDYNFNTNKVNKFDIRQTYLELDYMSFHFKYENNKVYCYDPDDSSVPTTEETLEIIDKTLSIRNKYTSKADDVINIDKDYSELYMNAMNYAFGGNM